MVRSQFRAASWRVQPSAEVFRFPTLSLDSYALTLKFTIDLGVHIPVDLSP